MNNYNALYPLIILYNALYIKTLSEVLPNTHTHMYVCIYIYIYISAVKRLIIQNTSFCLHNICVCVLCIFIFHS